MASAYLRQTIRQSNTQDRSGTPAVLAVAAAVTLLHLLTNGRYGFHRDELQFLSDARHLDWGFVAYPPLTPFLERISLAIFGVSLVGLRLISVLFQAAAIVVTGHITRELGGNRLAQIAAALAVALSALPLFEGTEFQYSSFDYLWWVLIAYFVVRLLKTGNPRWWLAVGATIGIALMTKYTVLFFLAGLVGGVVLTPARRYLWSRWFWVAVGLAALIFLPNFLWQVRHDFISIHFLRHIHARDVGEGRADHFLRDQFWICTNPFAVPLWIAGLMCFFRERRYRLLAWMYLIPLILFTLGKGRGYYLAAAYPMLIAMGAVAAERWLASLSLFWSRTLKTVYFTGLLACGALFAAILLPFTSSGPLKQFALKINGDLREEIGWPELVQQVAAIRDSLPPEQRDRVGIFVGNYGEQGAIEILGPAYRLPMPISMTNSAWLRGYPAIPPSALIVLGFSREDADRDFTGCRLVGHNGNSEGVKNEESQYHPDILLCDAPRQSWNDFWRDHQSFG